jgi:hypothetical protein
MTTNVRVNTYAYATTHVATNMLRRCWRRGHRKHPCTCSGNGLTQPAAVQVGRQVGSLVQNLWLQQAGGAGKGGGDGGDCVFQDGDTQCNLPTPKSTRTARRSQHTRCSPIGCSPHASVLSHVFPRSTPGLRPS